MNSPNTRSLRVPKLLRNTPPLSLVANVLRKNQGKIKSEFSNWVRPVLLLAKKHVNKSGFVNKSRDKKSEDALYPIWIFRLKQKFLELFHNKSKKRRWDFVSDDFSFYKNSYKYAPSALQNHNLKNVRKRKSCQSQSRKEVPIDQSRTPVPRRPCSPHAPQG